jgi:hypothetical protein
MAFIGRLLRTRRWMWLAIGLLVAVAAVGWHQALQKRGQRDDARADLQAERDLTGQQTEYVGELLRELEAAEPAKRWAAIWESADLRTMPLMAPPGGRPTLWGVAAFDVATGNAFLALGGLAVPEGQALHLWADHGDTHKNLGILRPDTNGRAVLDLEGAASEETFRGFLVSIEEAVAEDAPPPASPSDVLVLVSRRFED